MHSSHCSGRADPRSLTHRLASPNRLSAGRLVGASPVRLPSSCSPAPRSDRAAQHLPCTAATMTAPSRTTQADRGQNSMEGAAQHSELPADRTLSRAVVIGGSIAGMFAAAACAPHFDEVVPMPTFFHSFQHALQSLLANIQEACSCALAAEAAFVALIKLKMRVCKHVTRCRKSAMCRPAASVKSALKLNQPFDAGHRSGEGRTDTSAAFRRGVHGRQRVRQGRGGSQRRAAVRADPRHAGQGRRSNEHGVVGRKLSLTVVSQHGHKACIGLHATTGLAVSICMWYTH